jgi:hypothetical protein
VTSICRANPLHTGVHANRPVWTRGLTLDQPAEILLQFLTPASPSGIRSKGGSPVALTPLLTPTPVNVGELLICPSDRRHTATVSGLVRQQYWGSVASDDIARHHPKRRIGSLNPQVAGSIPVPPARPRLLPLIWDRRIPAILILPAGHEDLAITLSALSAHLTPSIFQIGILMPLTLARLTTGRSWRVIAHDEQKRRHGAGRNSPAPWAKSTPPPTRLTNDCSRGSLT